MTSYSIKVELGDRTENDNFDNMIYMEHVIKSRISAKLPLIAVLAVYLIAIFALNPLKNYPVNDDFFYLVQVKSILAGNFVKSALVTPSFMLQGLIGAGWAKIFGASFTSLRVLTLLFSILSLLAFEKILTTLTIKDKLKTISLLLFAFSPFFLINVPTFMTEIYFIFFALLSILFFLRYLKQGSLDLLILAGVFAGLSTMVRQFGVGLIVVFICTYFINGKDLRKYLPALLAMLPGLALAMIGIFWPQYQTTNKQQSLGLVFLFANPTLFAERIFTLGSLPYLFATIGGFFLAFGVRFNKRILAYIAIFAIFPAIIIFKDNIFKYGNIFFLDGVYAKSEPVLRDSLFSNIISKSIFSYIFGVCTVILILLIFKKIKSRKFDVYEKFLLLLGTLFFLISVLPFALYDRYFLVFISVGLLLITYIFNNLPENKYSFPALTVSSIILCLVTYLLVYDYYAENNLKNEMYLNLQNKRVHSSTFINGSLTKYEFIERIQNYSGTDSMVFDPEYVCYILNYEIKGNTKIDWFLRRLGNFTGTPQIAGRAFADHYAKPLSKSDTIYFTQEYFSPIYNLYGKHLGVRAYCQNQN